MHYLITTIKDTGKGIEDNRKEFLFQPFKELRQKQQLESVVDYGIGMGLSCSYELASSIGGSVRLVSSMQGNTVF